MGVGYNQIAVVVASGNTPQVSTAERPENLQASFFVYDHVASVTDHDCDAPDLVYIGTTSFGTRVSSQSAGSRQKVICNRRYGAPSDGRLRRAGRKSIVQVLLPVRRSA